MTNIYRYPADEHHVSAAAGALAAGQIVLYDGALWQVQGLKAIAVGEPYTLKKGIVVEVTKDSASTTFADAADVGIDVSAQEAVAATTGDVDVSCRKASTSSDTTVLVELPF